jgi:hypothetical protein
MGPGPGSRSSGVQYQGIRVIGGVYYGIYMVRARVLIGGCRRAKRAVVLGGIAQDGSGKGSIMVSFTGSRVQIRGSRVGIGVLQGPISGYLRSIYRV